MAKNERRQMPADGSQAARPLYTAKQGQYLAFIHAYQEVHRRAPPETDLLQCFQVSLPSVRDMILRLKRTRIDFESARRGAVHPDSAPAGAIAGIGVLMQEISGFPPSRSQPFKSQGIGLAIKILLQGSHKDFVVRSNAREQSHRRSKLQIIRVAEDLVDRASLYKIHKPSALP